jgi:hypothetical protein
MANRHCYAGYSPRTGHRRKSTIAQVGHPAGEARVDLRQLIQGLADHFELALDGSAHGYAQHDFQRACWRHAGAASRQSGGAGSDLPFDAAAKLSIGGVEIVARLEIDPKIRRAAEIPG